MNTERIKELKEKYFEELSGEEEEITEMMLNDAINGTREECQKEFQEKIEKFIKIFDKNDKDTIWSSAVVYFEFKQIFGEQKWVD